MTDDEKAKKRKADTAKRQAAYREREKAKHAAELAAARAQASSSAVVATGKAEPESEAEAAGRILLSEKSWRGILARWLIL